MTVQTLIEQMQEVKAANEILTIDQVLKIFQINAIQEQTRRKYG